MRDPHQHAASLHRSGDLVGAEGAYRLILKKRRSDGPALYGLGLTLIKLGRHADARKTLRELARLEPKNADARRHLALACKNIERMDEAHRAADDALRLQPEEPKAVVIKADLLLAEGRADEAAALLSPLVEEGGSTNPVLCSWYARLAPRVVPLERAIEVVLRALAALPASDDPAGVKARSGLLFRLGALLDKSERYGEAMEAFHEANRLIAREYDAPTVEAQITRVIEGWGREAMQSAPRSALRTERPIFIVGMPRSGTSVVEQILAAHPAVRAGGELVHITKLAAERGAAPPLNVLEAPIDSEAELTRAGGAYLETFGRLPKPILRVTDKLPMNFLHLGLIAQLFPGGRIIHCVRDERDTCLSCYFHAFDGDVRYAQDLGALSHFYGLYQRLMSHWEGVIDVPMLAFRYESLVESPEERIGELVSFAGLEWDEACARFHESGRAVSTASADQVVRPIYASSVGRWRHYERWLGG
jgi:Flp pilus assembly protein TadD